MDILDNEIILVVYGFLGVCEGLWEVFVCFIFNYFSNNVRIRRLIILVDFYFKWE